MVKITAELLRKRAEHNEGQLSNLEEISLHQQEIDKIEQLDLLCRHLKILYLQNNIIPRMENLNRLKELEYLNLALNNITLIENIESCESLKKLDLTLNFIPLQNLLHSLECLSCITTLEQLYLTGNPWYRNLTLAYAPFLKQLDGKDITPSERIKAAQQKDILLQNLSQKIEEIYSTPTQAPGPNSFTPESRVEYSKQLEQQRLDKERSRQESDAKAMNLNQKKFLFTTAKEKSCKQIKGDLSFNYEIKKKETNNGLFLKFSLIDIDVNPEYVRLQIKGKIFQIKFFEEVQIEKSKVLRSQTTGYLQLIMQKVQNSLVPFYNPFPGSDWEKSEIVMNQVKQAAQKSSEQSEQNNQLQKEESDEDLPPLE